jgi:hypothetical protein
VTDWIDKLTELRRRREAGEIDAAEFAAGRAEIFAERDVARLARPVASPPPSRPPGFAASPARSPAEELLEEYTAASTKIRADSPLPNNALKIGKSSTQSDSNNYKSTQLKILVMIILILSFAIIYVLRQGYYYLQFRRLEYYFISILERFD